MFNPPRLLTGSSTRILKYSEELKRGPNTEIETKIIFEMTSSMIIDFHTHIFPNAIRENRENYFPSEPAFKLLYDSPKSKLVGAKEIVTAMDEQGVDKSVVFGFPWKDSAIFKMQNDYVMEVVERYPDRLVGLSCFDPFNTEAVLEARRCLENGLSGIGEIAFYQSGIDDTALDKLTPLMEICLDKDLPFLMHTNEPVGHLYPGKTPNTLRQIYMLVSRFPENKIVLAHWGGGIFFFNLLKKEVKERLKNVYFDTAASPFLYDPNIYKYAVEIAGVDKILFGSDFPLLNPERYFKEFENTALSKDQVESMCGGNAAKLLKL
jgi:predicted TIM-barrel fold metal-dependent hydrolase